jgi:origin recognition complex subunit 3
MLLFGVATSTENLQDRISQMAVRCLAGQEFDVMQSEEILEQIFFTCTADERSKIRLGSQLSQTLLQRHQENLLSTQDFIDAAQVVVSNTHCLSSANFNLH